jgi:hypothetical protein
MLSFSTVRTVLAKPFMPPVFFFSGVGYDTLTLTRIDRLQDNLLLLIYLLLLGVLIVLTGRLGVEPAPEREQLTALTLCALGAARAALLSDGRAVSLGRTLQRLCGFLLS